MEGVFLRVLNMGITAGYCVLVILLLRLFLKKLPKIYSYVLWSVVYFRLVCPVSIKSVFSLLKVSPQTVPSDIGTRINPRITSGVPQVDVVVNAGLAQAAPEVGASANPMQIIVYAATVVWGIGVLLLFGYSVWSVLRLKRQLKGARCLEENLYESEKLHTPFVLGCFVPRIYLPADLGDKERVYVLAHERTHIRRRDYLIKEAAFLVTCIYWFHPLIWLAFYLMCRDMEMSCDESVIRSMGRENKKEYSAALLSLACGRQILNGSPLAFGEGGVKGRITNVLHYKRPAFWGGVALAIVLAAVLLGLALNPKEQYAQDESYKKEEQPVALTDFLMGQTKMPLGNGTVTVELWMTEGEYFDIEHAVPGGGIYEENYQGSYELRTVDSWGKVLDTRKLGADLSFWGEEASCNFPGKLDLAWTDYNMDGCPDFTIGMAGSSSTNFYQLYTVREDGTLAVLCESMIPGQAGAELSVVFEHDTSSEGLPLLGYFWNNTTGIGEHWFYYYNQETGLYEEGDKVIPKVENEAETTLPAESGGTEAGSSTDADSFQQAMYYAGYLDESSYSMWKNDWNDCDFDGDGKRDRIYRDVTEDAVSYRIDFGNSDVLDIGSFEDFFTGLSLQSADADGDGEMEILFVGAHMACTDPYDGSEIALFHKVNGSYQMASLPRLYDDAGNERGAYEAGWDLYAKDNGAGSVTFYSEWLDFEETITLEDGMTYEEIFSKDETEVCTACMAYDAEFIEYDGEVCLAFYENPGGRWLYQPVGILFAVDELDEQGIRSGRIREARLLTEEEAAQGTILGISAMKKTNVKTAASQNTGSKTAVHREGFIEPVLHLHVSDYLADSDYIDTSLLAEEEYRALAVQALQELYDLTGTQVEECYYYYNVQGGFLFAMSEADMDHDRTFYSRNFGEEDFAGAITIPQMHFSNARRTWFSPIYQYDLPENFADLPDEEKAVWFLEHSAVFVGGTVADYWQPYGDDIPQLWRIVMEDGTAYEVLLDSKIDAVTDITGPYPTSDFEH